MGKPLGGWVRPEVIQVLAWHTFLLPCLPWVIRYTFCYLPTSPSNALFAVFHNLAPIYVDTISLIA